MSRIKVQRLNSRAKYPANKPVSTPAERAAHVRKLQTLTQANYNQLFFIVKAIVPPQLCDAHDALAHGLLIALQKYEGKGPLTAYVPRCAYLYALQQAKKRRRQVNFTDLQTDEEFADYLDSVLPYLEDLYELSTMQSLDAEIGRHSLVLDSYEKMTLVATKQRCHNRCHYHCTRSQKWTPSIASESSNSPPNARRNLLCRA